MKYVELIGLPGSGKTALAHAVVARLRTQHYRALNRTDIRCATMQTLLQQKNGIRWKMTRGLGFVAKEFTVNLIWEKTQNEWLRQFIQVHAELACQMIDHAARVRVPAWINPELLSTELLLRWIFDLFSVYQAASNFLEAADLFVQEEGFGQHAYYFFAFRNGCYEESLLEQYVRLIPKPALLIVLTTPPELCEARMQQRTKGVASDLLTSLAPSQRITVLEQRWQVHTTLANLFQAAQIPVVRLANQDYHATLQQLETLIVSGLNHPSQQE